MGRAYRRRQAALQVVGGRGGVVQRAAATLLGAAGVAQLRECVVLNVPPDGAPNSSELAYCSFVLLAIRDALRTTVTVRSSNQAASVFVVTEQEVGPMHLRALAHAGIDRTYIVREPAGIAATVDSCARRQRAPLPPEAIELVPAECDSVMRSVATYCLRAGHEHTTVENVADHFSEDRKSLSEWVLHETGRRISWWLNAGRVCVARGLVSGGLSHERVAHRMGYANGSSVTLLLKRWTSAAMSNRLPQ